MTVLLDDPMAAWMKNGGGTGQKGLQEQEPFTLI